MESIIYTVGNIVVFIFSASIVLGVLLLVVYILFNLIANARFYYKSPRIFRRVVDKIIDFTRVWGPNLIIFYLLGSLLIRLLNFLGLA